jgi:hypothetical protein
VLALVAAIAIAAGALNARKDGKYVWTETKWILHSISSNERELALAFPSGGCTSDRGRAEFEETAESVRIEVESRDPLDAEVCTLDLRHGEATIRLRRPLNGRRVLGASRIGFFEPLGTRYLLRGERAIFRVPRVEGLAVVDAERLLEAHGFEVRRSRRTGVATGTSPAMGGPRPSPCG